MTEHEFGPSVPQAEAHSSVRFEGRDINPGGILISLLAIALSLIATVFLLWPLYGYLSSNVPSSVPPVSPILLNQRPLEPPEPRLQGAPGHEISPQEELRQMREKAEEQLNSYGWVNQEEGIARIPIDEAMRLLVESNSGERESSTSAPKP